MTSTNETTVQKKTVQERRKKAVQRFFRGMFSRRIVILGAIGVLFCVIIAVFAPVLAPYAPDFMEKGSRCAPASLQHLLGTDVYGRDLLTRIMYGARVSLLCGVISTLVAAAIGTFLGMLCAYCGGIVDKLLMRGCEVFNSIPQIAVSMTLITMFGGGMLNMALILCVGGIPGFLRMTRASALSIMNSDYITAAKLSGQSDLKILYKHVLPNCVSPIIVSAASNVGGTIMMESGLSFLGVGIKVPTPSWGSIINEARPFLMTSPLYALAPCVFLAILIISLNILGDGLRDALDPSLRGE